MKPITILGFVGSSLDAAKSGPSRWRKWRPSVAAVAQDDLPVARYVLLHGAGHSRLAEMTAADIREISPSTQVELYPLTFEDPWDFEEVYGGLLDFARSRTFDPDAEDLLVHITTGTHVMQICLFLLTEARFLPARLLQTSPPPHGMRDPDNPGPNGMPLGSWATIDLDLSRYDSIASRFAVAVGENTSFLKSGIETRNAAFNRLIDEIEQVASRSRAPILLTGPTGAGKSQLARRIYDLKRLKHLVSGPFVEVNCATLRGDGAMSALFGHRKGAFTGAVTDRQGLLMAADNGVLFLDEIAELGADEQAMILRAVEEKRFLPVGMDRDVSSDFQLIAGTNVDLARAARQGRFREDLFARLNLWTFALPGLRDRREDIEPNLDYELDRFAEREGDRVTFNKEARERYLTFATAPDAVWRGNFRDLAASVTRMATLSPRGRIDLTTVDAEINRLSSLWTPSGIDGQQGGLLDDLLGPERTTALDLFDRIQLVEVVKLCRRHRSLSAAGRELFAASKRKRTSTNDADRLRKYLARFDLCWADLQSDS